MSFPSAALAYKQVTFVNKMTDTTGLGGEFNMSTWRPTLESGWYYLGQGASDDLTTAPQGIIVHALEDDALRGVTSWERVWTDEGSPSPKDYSLWRGVPPSADYASSAVSLAPTPALPHPIPLNGIKTIRRDLLHISPMLLTTRGLGQ